MELESDGTLSPISPATQRLALGDRAFYSAWVRTPMGVANPLIFLSATGPNLGADSQRTLVSRWGCERGRSIPFPEMAFAVSVRSRVKLILR